MAFTYDVTIARGKIRAYIGDTVDETSVGRSLSDAEIDLSLDDADDVLSDAAVRACELLLAKLARQIDGAAGPITSQLSQKFAQTKELLSVLQDRSNTGGGIAPVADVASDARRDEIEADDDFTQPAFKVGMDDLP